MDVSGILADHAAKLLVSLCFIVFYTSYIFFSGNTAIEKDTPLDVDPGLLVVTDPNPIDTSTYTSDLESHLQSLAADGAQTLLTQLFSLPTKTTPEGPVAQLPPPTTLLPRSKPLPKPKPPTKWEAFASAKGIQKVRKEMKVWDEERQEWVNRWGKDGKNKEKEDQWIHEVKANARMSLFLPEASTELFTFFNSN